MSQLQQQQTQVSHKSPQTQGGSYLGRSTSLPSPESVQQSTDQYASRYGATQSNRETVIKSTISTLKKSHGDVISAYSEQKSSLPKRNPYALPGEPQLIDYLRPDIKSIPEFDTEIIEFLVRRDMGEIGTRRSQTTPTEYIEWLNDANAVYDTNWVNIQKEYDEKYPVYVEAHNKWRIEYEEQQRKLAEFEAEKSRIAQRDSEIAQEKAQKNREAEYVQDFNKNWSKYYGEEAKSVADVNRITYGAKESFQAAEQRIYEQKYGDNTFSGNQQTPEQQQAAAAFEFGLIAKDAAKTTDLDHLIGLSQPLHSTYAKLAPTVQVETKQFIKDFDTNVEIAKIERQKELKVEKYQNEFRQELKGIGFTDSEIAHVEQVARDRQKPASFDDQFSRSSYERRLNEFIQKNPESREYLTGGGSVKATAQFMGEGLTSTGITPTSREVIEVGDNTYYLTRYGSEGYEIRDKYGQIRSAGRGAVPDDVFSLGLKPLYFGNTLTPRYNPLIGVDLPTSAYGPVDVSDVIMRIQTKKFTGYDLPVTDEPTGIMTTPAWKDVELIHGFRTWIDETEKSILEQPNVQLVLNAVKQVDSIPQSQIFTNPYKSRALGNPFETNIQLVTGKSTDEHIRPLIPGIIGGVTGIANLYQQGISAVAPYNPIEIGVKVVTGKSSTKHLSDIGADFAAQHNVQLFTKPAGKFIGDIKISLESSELPESPDMTAREQQYRFLRGIPIGLTVGTAEMLATIRAAGEYGVSEVKSKGFSTIQPMAAASVTTVATGMVEGYKSDPAGFTGEFIGISKGMGVVTHGIGVAAKRAGQGAGIIRGKIVTYKPTHSGQNVPYASRTWQLQQILEPESGRVSGARGVSKPVESEYIPELGVYREAIRSRDPGTLSNAGHYEPGTRGVEGFFATIADKYVEPVGHYFLTKGTIFDKLLGGARVDLIKTRALDLPEQVRADIYRRVDRGDDFRHIYDTEILPRAKQQVAETGEPVIIPTPKQAEGFWQPELEGFIVVGDLSKTSVVTDSAHVGLTADGVPVRQVRFGSQPKISESSRGINAWFDNLRYNWDIGFGFGRFYNKNYLKSMAEHGLWKDLEIFDHTVPGRPGEYEQHGAPHSRGVTSNLLQQRDQSYTLQYLLDYQGAWARGRYHDITKITDGDPKIPYPHAWAAGEAIRTGILDTPSLRALSPAERYAVARDIAQHTDITPEWSLRGLKTRLIDRPSKTSQALANADRLDLVRFGQDVVVDRRKLFNIREDFSLGRFKFVPLDMSKKSNIIKMGIDQRITQSKNLQRVKDAFKLEEQRYLARMSRQKQIERARASKQKTVEELEGIDYMYKTRPYRERLTGYPVKPYGVQYRGGYKGGYPTNPYVNANYGYKPKTSYRSAAYSDYGGGDYVVAPYPAKPYISRPYPVKPYVSQPYPVKPYVSQPYPAKPYVNKITPPTPQAPRVRLPDTKSNTGKTTKKSSVSLSNVTNVNIKLPKTAIFGIDKKTRGNVIKKDAVTKEYVNGVLKRVKRIANKSTKSKKRRQKR